MSTVFKLSHTLTSGRILIIFYAILFGGLAYYSWLSNQQKALLILLPPFFWLCPHHRPPFFYVYTPTSIFGVGLGGFLSVCTYAQRFSPPFLGPLDLLPWRVVGRSVRPSVNTCNSATNFRIFLKFGGYIPWVNMTRHFIRFCKIFNFEFKKNKFQF